MPAGGDTRLGFGVTETKLEVGVTAAGKSRKTLPAMELGIVCITQSRNAGVSGEGIPTVRSSGGRKGAGRSQSARYRI
jgi:hypothetical protein